MYTLPSNVRSAQELNFDNAICPFKNPLGIKGMMIPAKNSPSTLGFRCKKWAQGQMGDKNANWRKGRGLGHGMVSKKYKVKSTREI